MFGKLEIHNFGPIKEAIIDTNDLTIFVGPQATGKSLTSQLFFLFNNIHEILLKSSYLRENLTPQIKFFNLIRWLFGNSADNLLSNKTHVKWMLYDYEYEFFGSSKNGRINQQLAMLIENQSHFFPPLVENEMPFHQNIFIPAERTIFSLLNPVILIDFRTELRNWPGNLLLFYDILSESLRILNDPKKYVTDQGGWAGVSFYLEELEIITSAVNKQSNILLNGMLNFNKSNDVVLNIAGKKISISYAASGQKEIWPYLVMLQTNFLNYNRAHKGVNFYYEEPEAHLHPKGQLELLKIIDITLHSRENYLVTTHSPFVLYFFNNSVLRGIHQDSKDKSEDFFDNNDYLRKSRIESFIPKKKMAAFAFSTNGKVKNIVNDYGLIDESELDDVANQLGTEFSLLQDQIQSSQQ